MNKEFRDNILIFSGLTLTWDVFKFDSHIIFGKSLESLTLTWDVFKSTTHQWASRSI